MQEDITVEKDQKEFNNYVAEKLRVLETALKANTEVTSEIADIVRLGTGFFRTVSFIGRWVRRIVVWLGGLAAGLYAIWQLSREFFKVKGG